MTRIYVVQKFQILSWFLEEMEERRKRGWKNSYLPLILKKFGNGDLASLYGNLHRDEYALQQQSLLQ